jgi:O-antigen/teichoic acid export membrane protein
MNTFLSYSAAIFFPRVNAYMIAFIFSRLLSVNDFGLYVLAMAIAKFCEHSSGAWFRNGFLRVYHPGNINTPGARPRISSIYLTCIICCALGIFMSWPICYFLGHKHWTGLATLTTIFIAGDSTLQMALYTLRGETRPRSYAFIESMRPILSFIVSVSAVKFIGANFMVAGIGLLGTNLVVGITAFAIVWKTRAKDTLVADKDYVGDTVRHAWPLIFSGFLVASMTVIDRYQLQWCLGPSAVALYAAAYSIGRQPVDILLNGMNLSAFTHFMKTYDGAGAAAASAQLRHQILLIMGAVLPLGISASVLAPDILHVLYDSRYWHGTPALVTVLAIAGLLSGLKSFAFDQGFYMVRRLDSLVLSFLPAFIIGICGSILFIRVFGFSGAAYGEIIGFSVSLLVAHRMLRRFLPFQIPWSNVAKLLICGLAMGIGMTFLENQLPVGGPSFIIKLTFGLSLYLSALLTFDLLNMRQRLFRMVEWLGLRKFA